MKIKPLLENVDVKNYNGRYTIQLEIPATSTLTSSEIDRIGAISSWDIDPRMNVDGYEGGRSALLSREKSITKKGIELAALQISGIGYCPIDFEKGVVTADFHPPTKENFIDAVPGTLMSTTYASHKKLHHVRPSYRALGTYLAEELKEKIKGTHIASQFNLENMVTPHIEAYGRFIEDTLQNDEGYFGFMVLPVPSVRKQRVGDEIQDKLKEIPAGATVEQIILSFFYLAAAGTLPLIKGLRELHDKEDYVHLQTHLSNVYSVNNFAYVMDWATLQKLGDDKENNLLSRVIDISKPVDSYEKLLLAYFLHIFSPYNF